MTVTIHPDKNTLGAAAAADGAGAIRAAIASRGEATIVVATGASQFEMLSRLVREPGIDWSKVTAFHLDEYIGLGMEHPASFRRYLAERFTQKLPTIGRFIGVQGDAVDTAGEIARLNGLISGREIDVCFCGVGENCHLAFNDPPADFATTDPYIVVTLDEACRRQQFGEGWFPAFEDVPTRAISMSINQMMTAKMLVLSVADTRKAEATRAALEGPVSPDYPASIVQKHANARWHLDPAAAALLVRTAA